MRRQKGTQPPPRRKRRPKKNYGFWNKEYKKGARGGAHLTLSTAPSEDLVKFTRWLSREYNGSYLSPSDSILDVGCGNGRNLIYLAKEFKTRGMGLDISKEAIAQAQKAAAILPLKFEVRSLAEPLSLPDASQALVLDMMASHFLQAEGRAKLLQEIARVLVPGGWLFFKTFLLEEDEHARKFLRDHPGSEPGSYIHPTFGGEEHVFTVEEIEKELTPHFFIHRMIKSHAHRKDGRAFKRRSISVYAQKQ